MAKTPHKTSKEKIKKPKPSGEDSIAEQIKEIDDFRQQQQKESSEEYVSIINRYANSRDKDKVTPWLLIRNMPTDLGLRPLPSNQPFWISPDIWIESSNVSGNPVAGEQNFVHVRIHNLGAADAAPVRVDFYWADPSLGLGPATMNLIGTEWVEIRSLHSKDVRCNKPWIPLYLNNGHECILVNCTNYILDPIHYPFQPTLDRHVGQLNCHVEKATAGQVIKALLKINNLAPFGLRQQVLASFERWKNDAFRHEFNTAVVQQAAYAGLQTNTALELKNRYSRNAPGFKTSMAMRSLLLKNYASIKMQASAFEPVTENHAQVKIDSRISEHGQIIYDQQAGKTFAERLIENTHLSGAQAPNLRNHVVLHELEMKPFEQRQLEVEITIPHDARPNEFIVVHFMQHTEMFAAGGYTYVFQVIK